MNPKEFTRKIKALAETWTPETQTVYESMVDELLITLGYGEAAGYIKRRRQLQRC